MWTSGFFNSINGDRVYTSEQMSSIFEGLITPGVYESIGNKLAVQPNDGMVIQINTGRGWFGGKWVNNDAEYLLTLADSDVLLNRYCAVCVKVDVNNESRTAVPYLKYGEFATAPTKPSMERTDSVKEYCLAYIYIPAGITSITASQIEDTRGDASLCGWVTGLIEQIDSTTLFAQFESLFMDWINNLNDYISGDVEAQLIADMVSVKQTTPKKSTGKLDKDSWVLQEENIYSQTIAVEGVTADNDILIAPLDEFKTAYLDSGCEAVSQGDGTVTFECTVPSETDIMVKAISFNDVV